MGGRCRLERPLASTHQLRRLHVAVAASGGRKCNMQSGSGSGNTGSGSRQTLRYKTIKYFLSCSRNGKIPKRKKQQQQGRKKSEKGAAKYLQN